MGHIVCPSQKAIWLSSRASESATTLALAKSKSRLPQVKIMHSLTRVRPKAFALAYWDCG